MIKLIKIFFILTLLILSFYYATKDYASPLPKLNKNLAIIEPVKCCLLITMYANTEKKVEMYKKVLNAWMKKSNLKIFTVDSSNSSAFQESTDLIRWTPFSFTQEITTKNDNHSFYELQAISKCFEKHKEEIQKYDYIIKLTGKYFTPHLEPLLGSNIPSKANLLLQDSKKGHENSFSKRFINKFYRTQSCELFGIKPDLFPKLYQLFEKKYLSTSKNYILEQALYEFSLKYRCYRFPQLDLDITHPRAYGDILSNL
jgi:hypothetical protein